MANCIYLDHNATTPLGARAAEVLARLSSGPANPSSQHQFGRKAKQLLEDARDRLGELLGCSPGDGARVIFTSGGSEANNLALLGLAAAPSSHDARRRVIVSSIEHPSVAGPAAELARMGFDVQSIRAQRGGTIDLNHLETLLQTPTRLVSLMLASNETGVLQPVGEASLVCKKQGAILHTDAVQAVGKIAVRFPELCVDALTLAAHKFHGPVGVGALVVRGSLPLAPRLHGGVQQFGLRPGTEPVALVCAMTAALEEALADSGRGERMQRLRDELEQRLVEEGGAVVLGERNNRLPQTSNLAFPGLDRQALVMALDLAGVAASSGSACASGSSEPSPTLLAMGLEGELVRSSVRFSLGAGTTAEEVHQAAERILLCVQSLRTASQRRKTPRPSRREPPNRL